MKRQINGFTVVEILITTGLITILSSILILYTRTGENQLILFREQSKIVSVIFKAKTLSVQTYSDPTPPCGYGVNFQPPRTVLLFKDVATPCAASDRRYSGSGELLETFTIDSRVSFTSTLTDVVFIPPDPTTFLTPAQAQATITLTAIGSGNTLPVKINDAGQVTTTK